MGHISPETEIYETETIQPSACNKEFEWVDFIRILLNPDLEGNSSYSHSTTLLTGYTRRVALTFVHGYFSNANYRPSIHADETR
jgi:hypothetical protein